MIINPDKHKMLLLLAMIEFCQKNLVEFNKTVDTEITDDNIAALANAIQKDFFIMEMLNY